MTIHLTSQNWIGLRFSRTAYQPLTVATLFEQNNHAAPNHRTRPRIRAAVSQQPRQSAAENLKPNASLAEVTRSDCYGFVVRAPLMGVQ